ncbi:uncharacterized, partial [Tachysurus ichikawai]
FIFHGSRHVSVAGSPTDSRYRSLAPPRALELRMRLESSSYPEILLVQSESVKLLMQK